MKSFFDIIAPPAPQTASDYIAGLSEPLASQARNMLGTATQHLSLMHADDALEPMPEIRIEFIPEVDGGAIAGRILLTHGLIELCSCLRLPNNLQDALDLPSGVDIPLPEFSLTFALMHEYFHVIRRHNASADLIGDCDRVSRALEHDADLCATASIYRLAQLRLGHELSDDQLRKLVLVVICWFLLKCPRSQNSAVQGALSNRLFGVLTKLVSVRRDANDPPDLDLEQDESREILHSLGVFLGGLGQLNAELEALIVQTLADIDTGHIYEPTESWNEIRETVGGVSGTMA